MAYARNLNDNKLNLFNIKYKSVFSQIIVSQSSFTDTRIIIITWINIELKSISVAHFIYINIIPIMKMYDLKQQQKTKKTTKALYYQVF